MVAVMGSCDYHMVDRVERGGKGVGEQQHAAS